MCKGIERITDISPIPAYSQQVLSQDQREQATVVLDNGIVLVFESLRVFVDKNCSLEFNDSGKSVLGRLLFTEGGNAYFIKKSPGGNQLGVAKLSDLPLP